MAQLTLLDVVQRYLNSANEDPVSNWNDTVVSEQVAIIAQEVYERVIQDVGYAQHTQHLGRLTGLGDTSTPSHMKIPDDCKRIEQSRIEYNVESTGNIVNYKEVEYVEPFEFLDRMNLRSNTDLNSQVVTDIPPTGSAGTDFIVYNRKPPSIVTGKLEGFNVLYFFIINYVA